jgi:hypothetical protein
MDGDGPGFGPALRGEGGPVWQSVAIFGLAMLVLLGYIAALIVTSG